jgi:hypothetical protein
LGTDGKRYFEVRDRLRALPLVRRELVVLEMVQGCGNKCYRHQGEMAREAKISLATWKRAKSELVQRGLLGEWRRGLKQTSVLWIDWEAIADLEAGIHRERIAPEPQPLLPFPDESMTAHGEPSRGLTVSHQEGSRCAVKRAHGELSRELMVSCPIDREQSEKQNSPILSLSERREMALLAYGENLPAAGVSPADLDLLGKLAQATDAELLCDALARMPAKMRRDKRAFLHGSTIQLDEALREAKRARDQAARQRDQQKHIEQQQQRRADDEARETELRRRWERMPASLQHEVDDEVRRRFPTIPSASWMLRRLVLIEKENLAAENVGDPVRGPPGRRSVARDGMMITLERRT